MAINQGVLNVNQRNGWTSKKKQRLESLITKAVLFRVMIAHTHKGGTMEKLLQVLPILIMVEMFLAIIPCLIMKHYGSAIYWFGGGVISYAVIFGIKRFG